MEKINWQDLINQLIGNGMTQSEIADKAGLSQPTVCDLANGRQKDTRFHPGTKLLGIYKRRFGRVYREGVHASHSGASDRKSEYAEQPIRHGVTTQ